MNEEKTTFRMHERRFPLKTFLILILILLRFYFCFNESQ